MVAELFVHGVVSIYNVWHAALHVVRCFDSPSQLVAVVAALERCKAHRPSEDLFDACSGLADKVVQRVLELERILGCPTADDTDAYRDVISRIGALGSPSPTAQEGVARGVKAPLPLLGGLLVDLNLALEAGEKATAGKSKAG